MRPAPPGPCHESLDSIRLVPVLLRAEYDPWLIESCLFTNKLRWWWEICLQTNNANYWCFNCREGARVIIILLTVEAPSAVSMCIIKHDTASHRDATLSPFHFYMLTAQSQGTHLILSSNLIASVVTSQHKTSWPYFYAYINELLILWFPIYEWYFMTTHS